MKNNAAQIQRNIDLYIITRYKNLEQAFHEVGLRGVAIVKRNTPVKTGRLRASMAYTVNKTVYGGSRKRPGDTINATVEPQTVIVGTNVIYGPSVEYYSKTGSKGFMLRSYKDWKPIAERVLKEAMSEFNAGLIPKGGN